MFNVIYIDRENALVRTTLECAKSKEENEQKKNEKVQQTEQNHK